MTITPEQLSERHKYLGATDIVAAMGFSRFASPYDIFLLKTQRVKPKDRTESYITAGNLLEEPLVKWLSKYIGKEIDTEPNRMEVVVTDMPVPVVVHLDGRILSTGNPAECKTEGVDHPMSTERRLEWGESGTDEVPEDACIQAHAQLMATDRDICHVMTFLGGRGFQYFFVKRDNRLVEMIRKQAIHFWEEHVLKDIPPEDCAPSLTMIKQIRRVEGDPVTIDSAIVQKFIDSRDASLAADKAKTFHQAELLAHLDGAEIGVYDVSEEGKILTRYVTNFEQNRKGYEVKPSSFRVMRMKKKL